MPEEPAFHEGRWLKELLTKRASALSAAGRMNVDYTTLTRWFKKPKLRMHAHYQNRLLEYLNMSSAAFEAAKIQAATEFALQSKAAAAAVRAATAPTRSVSDMIADGEPIGEENARQVEWLDSIPIVEQSLAAGPWTDVMDLPDAFTMAQVEKGLFGVRLGGDSMEPVYPSGRIVIFQVLREGLDEVELGRDYYVQRDDGAATFKRIVGLGESQVRLKALNAKKYPHEWHVNRVQIVRLARAMGKFEPVE